MLVKYVTNNFPRKQNYVRHMENLHEIGEKSTCPYCGKTSKNPENLNLHIQRVHVKDAKFRKFLCDQCESAFDSIKSLELHSERIHVRIKNKFCSYLNCSNSFYTIKDVSVHEKGFHLKANSYACESCEKRFPSKRNLLRHTDQNHTVVGKFHCYICVKNFSDSGSVKAHKERIHDGIKRFKCEYCDRAFADIGNMTRHVEDVHLKVKKFACGVCSKSFSQHSSLRGHMNSVHKGFLAEKPTSIETFQGWNEAEIEEVLLKPKALSNHIKHEENSMAKIIICINKITLGEMEGDDNIKNEAPPAREQTMIYNDIAIAPQADEMLQGTDRDSRIDQHTKAAKLTNNYQYLNHRLLDNDEEEYTMHPHNDRHGSFHNYDDIYEQFIQYREILFLRIF